MTADHRLIGMMIQMAGHLAGDLVLIVDVRLVVDLVDFQVIAGVQIVAETVVVVQTVAQTVAGDLTGQRATVAGQFVAGQFVADHFAGADLGAMMFGRVEQIMTAELVERIQQHFGSLRTRTNQFGILVQTLFLFEQKIFDSKLMLGV